jgi:hypothetical protein
MEKAFCKSGGISNPEDCRELPGDKFNFPALIRL